MNRHVAKNSLDRLTLKNAIINSFIFLIDQIFLQHNNNNKKILNKRFLQHNYSLKI